MTISTFKVSQNAIDADNDQSSHNKTKADVYANKLILCIFLQEIYT